MLKINCYFCDKELEEPGGLIFSPPDKNDRTHKFHVCNVCYTWIFWTMETEKENQLDLLDE